MPEKECLSGSEYFHNKLFLMVMRTIKITISIDNGFLSDFCFCTVTPIYILCVLVNGYEHATLITLSSPSQKAEHRRWVTTDETGDKTRQRAERLLSEEIPAHWGAWGQGLGARGGHRQVCTCHGRVAPSPVKSHPGLKPSSNARSVLPQVPWSWPIPGQMSATQRLAHTCAPDLHRALTHAHSSIRRVLAK